ncbi:MAG: dihydrofolate reductase, partial [Pedobacter sp.]
GRALPNRKNIVISRQQTTFPEGVIHANDLNDALAMCASEESIFIIGGGSIYETALPFTDVIELTTVHQEFQADVFFPKLDTASWRSVTSVRHEADEKNAFPYTFSRLVRS